MKNRTSASTHKRVTVLLFDGMTIQGYLKPLVLEPSQSVDILTLAGEHKSLDSSHVKCVYFVREFTEPFEPARKTFLNRPKLDGLWVQARFRDQDVMEGIVSNDLLGLMDASVQITPPDLHGNTLRILIPRSALQEMKVLGVVGVSRRSAREGRSAPASTPKQSKLFDD